jgi:hypothetical protein
MAAIITLSCPNCKQQIKAPAEARGKRVKCKACGEIFTAAATAKASPASAKAKPAAAAKPKPKPSPAASKHADLDDDGNPYGVTDLDATPRCPHCAGEMGEGDIICLNCGYNTQTREMGKTVKVIANTPGEWIVWLAPGMLCALMLIPLTGVHLYLWLGYANVQSVPHLPLELSKSTVIGIEKEGKEVDGWLPARIWGSVFAAAAMWFCIWFAIRRLIKHPHPPMKVKNI